MSQSYSELQQLAEHFNDFFKLHPGVECVIVGEALELRPTGQLGKVISIEFGDRGWTVSTEKWHGHYKTWHESVKPVTQLLGGYARTVQEFKGETVSATWLELQDAEGLCRQNFACYLNPDRPEEWDLEVGERWKCIATVVRYIDVVLDEAIDLSRVNGNWQPRRFEPGETEWAPDRPHIWNTKAGFTWFEAYGAPVLGLRWEDHGEGRLIYQLPSAWIRQDTHSEEAPDSFTNFLRPGGAARLGVRIYINKDEGLPEDEEVQLGVHPARIEPREERFTFEGVPWRRNWWQATYVCGTNSMIAQIFMDVNEDAPEISMISLERKAFEEALNHSYYKPSPGD